MGAAGTEGCSGARRGAAGVGRGAAGVNIDFLAGVCYNEGVGRETAS